MGGAALGWAGTLGGGRAAAHCRCTVRPSSTNSYELSATLLAAAFVWGLWSLRPLF